MEYSKSKRRNLISISITLLIVLMLIISGPASGVLITMTPPPDHAVGETVTFTVDIKLLGSDLINITNINVTNLPLGNISFYPDGTKISGDSGYEVTRTGTPNYSNGSLYGYDENPGSPDYGYGFDFGIGYGYGQPGAESHLIYDIDISGLPVGTYTSNDVHIDVFVAGNNSKPTFSVVENYDFKINPKPTSTSGSSGGGGGGGGASSEKFENIICSEVDRQFVGSDQEVSFSFEFDCNYVKYINLTGVTNSGKIAAKVETLNHTSSLVDIPASDIVFKNLNVWAGNMGWFSENNVKDPTIMFMVDRSWVKNNSIILNTISFYSYNDVNNNWEKRSTQKISEDSNSYYFKASLPIRGNLGPMAISGSSTSAPVHSSPTIKPTITPQPTPEIVPGTPGIWTGIWKEKVPGFQILTALFVLIALYVSSRRRN